MAIKSVAFIENNEGESMWSDIFLLDNIFFRGCVTDVVVPSYVVGFIYMYIYIHIMGQLGFVSFITVQFYDVCTLSSTLWPDGRTRLFAHYTTPLSWLCRRIRRYWTSKMVVMYILPSVCLWLSQFAQLYFMQFMGLCIKLTHLSYDDCENMCILSYYHHQIGRMTHLPLFKVRSWSNSIRCLFIFLAIEWFISKHHSIFNFFQILSHFIPW